MIKKEDLRIGNSLLYCMQYDLQNPIKEDSCEWVVKKIDWQDLRWLEESPKTFNKAYRGITISETILGANNFVFDGTNTGIWWLNLQTHYLEMISAADGWYPIYIQLPELSSEAEQRVGLERIEYIHELENLFHVLKGGKQNIKL